MTSWCSTGRCFRDFVNSFIFLDLSLQLASMVPNITHTWVLMSHPRAEAQGKISSVPMVLSCYIVKLSASVHCIIFIFWRFLQLLRLLHPFRLTKFTQVKSYLLPPSLGHPLSQFLPCLHKYLQYYMSCNILGYSFLAVEDIHLHLLQDHNRHCLIWQWIIPAVCPMVEPPQGWQYGLVEGAGGPGIFPIPDQYPRHLSPLPLFLPQIFYDCRPIIVRRSQHLPQVFEWRYQGEWGTIDLEGSFCYHAELLLHQSPEFPICPPCANCHGWVVLV